MKNYCSYLQAIVLDWAGTTVDHGSRAPAAVFQKVFQQRDIDVTIEQAREPMGMAKREHIAAIGQMPSIAEAWLARYGTPFAAADVESLYIDFLPMQKAILAEHSDVIAGVVEAVGLCREMGLKIGSSTGYTRELMSIVAPAAAKQGYAPDFFLCSEDAPRGRPAPFLLFEAAKRFDVYPMSRIVKVDDTVVGIQAGRNAGCWTVGITRTGNLIGMSAQAFAALETDEQAVRLENAADKLQSAGANFVVESLSELPQLLQNIDQHATCGERPVPA